MLKSSWSCDVRMSKQEIYEKPPQHQQQKLSRIFVELLGDNLCSEPERANSRCNYHRSEGMHLHRMPTSGGSVQVESLRHGPVRQMVRETPFSWIGNRCRLSSWTQIPCVSDFGGPRLAVRRSSDHRLAADLTAVAALSPSRFIAAARRLARVGHGKLASGSLGPAAAASLGFVGRP